ncbi:MAG TPA: diguanylate cyclase [Actinomycetes bacterium]|nr:diguanylate cyclase [Actinomycetes bacterium]
MPARYAVRLVQVGAAQADESEVTGGPGTRRGTPWEAALPLVGALVAALMASYAVLHLLLLDGRAQIALATVATAAAVGLGATSALTWRRGVPAAALLPLSTTLVVLLAAHAVLAMVTTGDLAWTSSVLLAIFAAGALLSRLRWLIGALYVTWGIWLAGLVAVGPAPQWTVAAVSMLAATGLAVALQVSSARLLAALDSAAEMAEVVAVRDSLTGLANRRGLQMLAAPIVEAARRQGDAVHAMFLVVDGLTAPDGAHQQPAGDELVLSVGEALTAVTRATDVIARWETDTFVVAGPGSGMSPLELERRVRDRLIMVAALERGWSLRISAGAAMLAPWDAGTLDSLLDDAAHDLTRRQTVRWPERRRDRRAAAE